jgi:flavin reductase (DIM6/NTAB) family NADH-FMN oxidoreductase RutF
MPEGTTLEDTARVARALAEAAAADPDVTDLQLYVGTASPYNFNGLIRHYFPPVRQGANVADVQVNLRPRGERRAQSHEIAGRLRPALQRIAAASGARLKVAEVPPGPPVLQTLVAEVYGDDRAAQLDAARRVLDVFERTPGVVDVDWHVEAPQAGYRLVIDKEKAALAGISTDQMVETLRVALDGVSPGLAHLPAEKEDVPIVVRLPRAQRSGPDALTALRLRGAAGALVPLSELVRVEPATEAPFVWPARSPPPCCPAWPSPSSTTWPSAEPAFPGIMPPTRQGGGAVELDLRVPDPTAMYKLLIGCVVPRPIAWVSSVDAAGVRNLAPFSYFMAITHDPPTIAFSSAPRGVEAPGPRGKKDTLGNVEATGEFVVNVVDDALAAAMNVTSGDYPPDVDEFELAGLAAAPSVQVKPPRVAAAPISMECRVVRILPVGNLPHHLVIGQVVHLHVRDDVHDPATGRIDMRRLRPVGRLAGQLYTHVHDIFEMTRPTAGYKG